MCSRHISLSKVEAVISPQASYWIESLIVLGSQALVSEPQVANSASGDCCDSLYEKPNMPLAILQGPMISRWELRVESSGHLTDAYIYYT